MWPWLTIGLAIGLIIGVYGLRNYKKQIHTAAKETKRINLCEKNLNG